MRYERQVKAFKYITEAMLLLIFVASSITEYKTFLQNYFARNAYDSKKEME